MAFLRRKRRENNVGGDEVEVVEDKDEENVEFEVEVMVEAEDERRVGAVLLGVEGLEEAIEPLDVWRVPIFGRAECVFVAADAWSNGSSSQYRSIIDETSS